MSFDLGNTMFPLQILTDPRKFERACFRTYSGLWDNTKLIFVGSPGKQQYGLDIVGLDRKSQQTVGVQCKNYTERLSNSDVRDIIKLVDEKHGNKFGIEHLVIAVPAPGSAPDQAEIMRISRERAAAGKFTLSVDYLAEIVAGLSYSDRESIHESFPDFTNGYGLENLQRQFPISHKIHATLDRINLRPGERTASSTIGQDFDQWVAKDCFSHGKHASNQWVTMAIPRFDPEYFCFQVYVRDHSRFFPDCRRSVDIEGFNLFFSNSDVERELWEQIYGYLVGELTASQIDDIDPNRELAVRLGYLRGAVGQVADHLREAGAIRWVWPKSDTFATVCSPYMKVLIEECGFVEQRDRGILVKML